MVVSGIDSAFTWGNLPIKKISVCDGNLGNVYNQTKGTLYTNDMYMYIYMYMYTYIFWNLSVYTLSYLSPVQRWLRELFRLQNKLDQDPVSLLTHEILHHLGCNKNQLKVQMCSDILWILGASTDIFGPFRCKRSSLKLWLVVLHRGLYYPVTWD